MEKNKLSLFFVLLIVVILLTLTFYEIFIPTKITTKILVTSPQKGESWTTGSTHTISWTTRNISANSKISVTLQRVPPPPLQIEGQEFDPIVFINLENTGSTTWKISNMYPTGTYIMSINSYTSIPITNTISAESSSFNIINPSKISYEQKDKQTSGWKTYKNINEGYSFEYPEEWNVITNKYNPKNTLFGPGATNESGYGGVEFSGTLSHGQSLADFVKKMNLGIEGGSVSETETVINNQSAVISFLPKASIEPTEIESVSFEKDGKVFNIYLEYKTNFTLYRDDEKRLDIFNKILSTFSLL